MNSERYDIGLNPDIPFHLAAAEKCSATISEISTPLVAHFMFGSVSDHVAHIEISGEDPGSKCMWIAVHI